MSTLLFEDSAMIAIDKPSGLPTVSTDENPISLAAWIINQWPVLADIGFPGEGAGLLHRLDNETSGIVLVAKTQTAFDCLRAQFDAHTIIKIYTALVVGVTPNEGTITTPIAHHPTSAKKMIVAPSPDEARQLKAREAHTTYRVLERFPNYTLLEVTITTGLRHQIRVHLASLGYPLAGDKQYGSAASRQLDPKSLTRHFLHASSVTLVHPITQAPITIQSPLPTDLDKCLDNLRLS